MLCIVTIPFVSYEKMGVSPYFEDARGLDSFLSILFKGKQISNALLMQCY